MEYIKNILKSLKTIETVEDFFSFYNEIFRVFRVKKPVPKEVQTLIIELNPVLHRYLIFLEHLRGKNHKNEAEPLLMKFRREAREIIMRFLPESPQTQEGQ